MIAKFLLIGVECRVQAPAESAQLLNQPRSSLLVMDAIPAEQENLLREPTYFNHCGDVHRSIREGANFSFLEAAWRDHSVLYALASAAAKVVYALGAKLCVQERYNQGSDITIWHLLALRGIIGIWAAWAEKTWGFSRMSTTWLPGPGHRGLLLASGVTRAVGNAAGLWATVTWSMADVNAIVNTSPTITVVLTAVMCIEPLTVPTSVGLVFCVLGATMLIHPSGMFGSAHTHKTLPYWPLPAFCALGQAISGSVASLLVRRAKGASAASVSFYVFLPMLIVGITGAGISGKWVPSVTFHVIPITGCLLVAFGGYTSTYWQGKALTLSKSILVVSLQYAIIVFSALVDTVFLGVDHVPVAWVGMAILIFAGLLLVHEKLLREQEVQTADGAFRITLPRRSQ